MQVESQIIHLLSEALQPEQLRVENESHQHNVPAGSESHFKVNVVSSHFEGKRLLQRHRLVNSILAELLAGPIHALALHTHTPTEWAQSQEIPLSPKCRGGS